MPYTASNEMTERVNGITHAIVAIKGLLCLRVRCRRTGATRPPIAKATSGTLMETHVIK